MPEECSYVKDELLTVSHGTAVLKKEERGIAGGLQPYLLQWSNSRIVFGSSSQHAESVRTLKLYIPDHYSIEQHPIQMLVVLA